MKSLFSLCFFLFCFFSIQAEIVEFRTMEEVRKKIGSLDRETLLVFDVDNTLTIPSEPSFQMPNIKQHRALVKNLTKHWSAEDKKIGLNYMVLQGSVLLDNVTGNWIWMLQDHQIPIMAFSNTLTTPLGNHFHPYIRKEEILRSLNVDFTRSPPDRNNFVIDSFSPLYETRPLYQNGILHGNGMEKGEVFSTFLEWIEWKPKKVIFIDDLKENVESLGRVLSQRNIEYLGIYFTGAHTARTTVVNRDVMTQQWNTLVQIVKNIAEEKTACLQES